MPTARTIDFDSKDVRLSDLAKALSHPARIAILRVLAKKGECICGELVSDLPLAQSTVSQHLKALKEIDLIRGEIDGPRTCYCINWSTVREFHKLSGGFFDSIIELEQKFSC